MDQADIHGIDMEEAMARLMGNGALLMKVINGLHQMMLDESSTIVEQLKGGNGKDPAAKIHQYKGLAANVSARQLHALLVQCEAACKGGDAATALAKLEEAQAEMQAIHKSASGG